MRDLLAPWQPLLEDEEPNLDILKKQLHLLSKRSDAAHGDDTQRLEVMTLLRRAIGELEKPPETLRRIRGGALPVVTARIGQNHKLFETLNSANETVGLDQLERASGIQADVLDSIMEYLCSQSMAAHDGQGRYKATKLSHFMMEPHAQAWTTYCNDLIFPSYAALNKSLLQHNGPPAFNLAHGTDDTLYAWLEAHEPYQSVFYKVMEFMTCRQPSWLDVVDFEGDFGHGGEVAFVDVGGGVGQQCRDLLARHATLSGRVVLQDLSDVLSKVPHVDGMTTMGYDFCTEQPIKSARVYYLRQILHNCPDEVCLEILHNQKTSLGADSVMVIDDKVLPDVSDASNVLSTEYVAMMGITMHVLFKACERRESHWRRLMDRAGLVLREVRHYSALNDAIMIVAIK